MSVCVAHPWALNDGDCIVCLRLQRDTARENLDGLMRASNGLGSAMVRVLEVSTLPPDVRQEAVKSLFVFRAWREL